MWLRRPGLRGDEDVVRGLGPLCGALLDPLLAALLDPARRDEGSAIPLRALQGGALAGVLLRFGVVVVPRLLRRRRRLRDDADDVRDRLLRRAEDLLPLLRRLLRVATELGYDDLPKLARDAGLARVELGGGVREKGRRRRFAGDVLLDEGLHLVDGQRLLFEGRKRQQLVEGPLRLFP